MMLTPEQHARIAANRNRAKERRCKRLLEPSNEPEDSDSKAVGLTPEKIARIATNRTAAMERRQSRAAQTVSALVNMMPLQPAGLVLPDAPLDWNFGTLPEQPVDFGAGFELPGHEVRLLQTLNPHPRDKRLNFIAVGHLYLIDGTRSLGSVTGLVKQFAHQFDPDVAIQNMMNSRRWPRPEYSHPDGVPLSPTEIKLKWSSGGQEAANRGTWMHFTCELWLNRCPTPMCSTEMELFMKFVQSLGGLRAYRTEWEIFGAQEWLAGSIDFVAESVVDGSLVVVDWKRTKQLRHKFATRFGEQMLPPLTHIANCCGQLYRLQLNCYKYLLEKYYGRRVSSMLIVGLHRDVGSAPFVDCVPPMPSETEVLMSHQRDLCKRKFGLI